MSLSSFLCLPVINQIPSATFSDIPCQLLLLYLLKGLALLSDIYLLLYTGSYISVITDFYTSHILKA